MESKAKNLFKSIETVASAQTERKEPPKQNGTPIEPKNVNEAKQEQPKAEQKTEFFGSEEKKTEGEQIKKLSETEIINSGKTAAYLTAGIIETFFGLGERLIYLSKFTKEEKQIIIQIQEKDDNNLDDKEQQVNRKFLAINKKHNRIKERIPLSDKDEEALAVGFSEYTRQTGKSANPQLILYSVISKVLVMRSMDIFLD